MSTLVGESIVVRKIYRGCVVSVLNRETLVDLIELKMTDFNVILGMDCFISTMVLWIIGPKRSVSIFLMI